MKARIETEIRIFLSKAKYEKLKKFFRKNAKFLGADEQETHYLKDKSDLRIQKNKRYAKIWLKKGKLNDEAREELEVKFDRKDFEKLK